MPPRASGVVIVTPDVVTVEPVVRPSMSYWGVVDARGIASARTPQCLKSVQRCLNDVRFIAAIDHPKQKRARLLPVGFILRGAKTAKN
jgi:hypothetical protein